MTMQITRWFEYGQPTENNRVEAEIRTAYQTGPNDPPRDDDVREGTVAMSALELMENDEDIQQHTHDDGSVLLSNLPDEKENELLTTFEE